MVFEASLRIGSATSGATFVATPFEKVSEGQARASRAAVIVPPETLEMREMAELVQLPERAQVKSIAR